jgi:hypothetical protein
MVSPNSGDPIAVALVHAIHTGDVNSAGGSTPARRTAPERSSPLPQRDRAVSRFLRIVGSHLTGDLDAGRPTWTSRSEPTWPGPKPSPATGAAGLGPPHDRRSPSRVQIRCMLPADRTSVRNLSTSQQRTSRLEQGV